eukprot:TRINITY_DN5694_c0_g1_i1.p1 TRINITY_DN5694_c0_g1~~TRINITY_DN5694_c0_g1_i1.p1  ORF type:complete len:404 (-),score=33.87 TRINITY_DN5694_c0_g1_i1:9-1220(-)
MNIRQFIFLSLFLGVLLFSSGHFIYELVNYNHRLIEYNEQLITKMGMIDSDHQKLQGDFSQLSQRAKEHHREIQQSRRRLKYLKDSKLINVPEKITVLMYRMFWWSDEENKNGWIKDCDVPCYHTKDLAFLSEADAVMTLGDVEYLSWPEETLDPNFVNKRGKIPLRVGIAMEPDYWRPYQTTEKWKSQFDILSTYHLDSDIPIVYTNFGEKEARNMPVSFREKRTDALMLVMVSNCEAKERYNFLGELMDKMSIHSYGRCHNNSKVEEVYPECSNPSNKVREKKCLLPHYKFAWALENSQIEDYVSEKLFWPLEAGTIPLYLGAPNVDEFLPSTRSIIKVNDFDSTDKLVEYLKFLAENETLYNQYLDWKSKPFHPNFQRSLDWGVDSVSCRVCRYIAGLDP